MGEVPSLIEPHGQDRVSWLKQRLVDPEVGIGTRMWLHIRVLRTEQRFEALDGQRLDLVDHLVAAVVATTRIALCILVGQHRPRRGEHRW